jgi:hypothetical protein
MSTKQMIRSGLMGSAAFATLGLTACANSHAQSPRYGAGTHYDYESAQSCGSSCTTGVTTPSYRPAPVPTAPRTHYGYEGVPCGTSCSTGGYTGVVSTGYPTVTSGYTTGSVSTGYSQETAPCPAGTTSQPDGTCMQGGSHTSYTTGSSSYIGGSSYSSGGYSSSGYSTSGGVADCPAGTTTQPDGSCLQGGGSSYSSHTTSTYSAPVTSTYSSTYAAPTTSTYVAPELTTECCAPVSSATTVYSGDAGTATYGGYATSGSTYSSSDYLPIRK